MQNPEKTYDDIASELKVEKKIVLALAKKMQRRGFIESDKFNNSRGNFASSKIVTDLGRVTYGI